MRETLYRFLIVASFVLATTSLPLPAQVVTATLPVGNDPGYAAVNTVTNKIYVANSLCNSLPCPNTGTVTVIDGATNSIVGTVTVGVSPAQIAVDSATNKIYVTNVCGNDTTCQSPATVTVIDGSTLATSAVTVGYAARSLAVNPVTNQIYVANQCLGPGYPNSCTVCETGQSGTITAINGTTLQTQTVPLECSPFSIAVNSQTNTIYAALPGTFEQTGALAVVNGSTLSVQSVTTGYQSLSVAVDATTNQIYVTNVCGSDPNCQSTGTVTAVDGTTLSTQTVNVGYVPFLVATNPAANNIYVDNLCGSDPACASQPTVTVINGKTLSTTTVPICNAAGDTPGDLEVNSVTNKVYLPCSSGGSGLNRTVTVIDGATNTTTPVAVGDTPMAAAVNSVTNNIYVPNGSDATVSVIGGATEAQLNNVTPCRLVDTRSGSPIQGGTFEAFNLPQLAQQKCPGLNLSSAISYSLNVTLVPDGGPVGYLTIWPDSQLQPVVSTMNSDGRIKANAAIVSAGLNGAVDIYVANTANVILDIDAYFGPAGNSTLQFYPLTPCRVADTRSSDEPQGLGAPYLMAGQQRSFPLLNATTCFPSGVTPAAYSLNFTAVPHGPLGYLTIWPTGQLQPTVSTLNAPTGAVTANAAIVPAGTSGEIEAYAYNDTDLIIDIDGYFAAPGSGGLSLYPTPPCRVLDTRPPNGNGAFTGTLNPPVNVLASPCAVPSSVPASSLAYNFNGTVVPQGSLGYLSLWPVGLNQPVVSTLNAYDGAITSNMAIVPAGTNGEINAYAGFGTTNLILDISAFYAP